jgi:glycosyltransferase involved in cell wall biosynthesis
MRIGVDYRLLSAGTNTVNRGMGRYTQQQLREALRADGANEFVLLCRDDADLGLLLPEIRGAPNVSVARFTPSAPWTAAEPNPPDSLLRLAEEYQDWVARQRIDLYHATTPFLFKDTVLHRFDACPLVATFYDLIPLIFPDQYLPPDAQVTALYGRAVQLVSRADRLIAISQSARDDAVRYLGFPAERIDVAYPIPDPWFRPLAPAELRAALAGLRRRVALPDAYVFSVTYPHHSKNVERMLEGYSLLPAALRRRAPLVLTFEITGSDRERVGRLADRYGVAGDVLLTDFVSEEELVALYNGALALLHPSRYEGFGLPVVEAMRCGAPVITSTTSSLPEAGGDAAILVDPDDPQAIAAGLAAIIEEPARRAEMRERGLAHAARFTPEQLGASTAASYARLAADVAARAPDPRPRLALWTPLPPQQSGIADYCAEVLLDELDRSYELEIFVDDGYLPDAGLLGRYAIHHHSAFERRHRQRPFATAVYQLGASFFHLYMQRAIERFPGVVVLHDLLWSSPLYWRAREQGRLDAFRRELRELEGEAALREFDQIHAGPGPAAEQLERFIGRHFMLGRVAASSRALVVHSAEFAAELRARYPDAAVHTLLLGMEDMWRDLPPLRTALARERLGLPRGPFVVGVFGIVDRVKRVDAAIRAFARVAAGYPDALLLIAGQQPDPVYVAELRRLVEELGLGRSVHFFDGPPKGLFNGLILACDAVVNLRWPSRKQMSAALMRAVAAGKPTIITGLPEWAFLPESFCLRVDPGPAEVEQLAAHLLRLAASPALRDEAARAARAWYEREATPRRVGDGYRAVLSTLIGPPAPEPPAPPGELPLSKLAAPADLRRPELAAALRDLLGRDPGDEPLPRGVWGEAMAAAALRRTNALRPDAAVLFLGAAASPLLYLLEAEAGEVFAADRYLDPGAWAGPPPQFMLAEPGLAAPACGDTTRRLVPQHLGGLPLRLPDARFDAVVCADIGAAGTDLAAVAGTAYEIGRVLRPGGVAAITALLTLAAPPGAPPPAVPLLDAVAVRRAIVEASGLEPVGELCLEPSAATLAARRTYARRATAAGAGDVELAIRRRGAPLAGETAAVAVEDGYVFCELHLALRKTERYPAAENGWARADRPDTARSHPPQPPPLAGLLRGGRDTNPDAAVSVRESSMSNHHTSARAALHASLAEWEQLRLRGWYNRALNRLPRPVGYAVRTVDRVLMLGRTLAAQSALYRAMVGEQDEARTALAAVERRVAALEIQLQQVAQSSLVSEQQARLVEQLGHLADQQSWIAGRLAEIAGQQGETAAAVRRAEAAVDALERRQRQSVSDLRALQLQLQSGAAPESGPAGPISEVDLRWLLQCIEAELPELRERGAVELSVQGPEAEAAIVAGATYLGNRMASHGDSYRAPNDLWYHVDFTADWERPVLFESARARLARGGAFALVTEAGRKPAAEPEGLEQVYAGRLSLISGRQVQAYVWRRV